MMADPVGLKASVMLEWAIHPFWDKTVPYPGPLDAVNAFSWATTLGHSRALFRLQQRIRSQPAFHNLFLTDAILLHLVLMAQESKNGWSASTHFRELTKYVGAFSHLGVYVPEMDIRVNLVKSATFHLALKAWDYLAKQHQPVNLPAATADQILKAVELQQDTEIRVFIMLLWLLAGRKGDISHLLANQVHLDMKTGRLSAFVSEGKGVKARQGMYHIVTHCPPQWRQEIQEFLSRPRRDRYLFRKSLQSSSEVITAIRLANPVLSCRSVRRGAAQALASDPSVSCDTIMKITGHKQEKTLHRYLNWDKVNERQHAAAQTAAMNNLMPQFPWAVEEESH